MDKSLLKRTAIQSVALMMAVITSSYALNQYQTVTIEAVAKTEMVSPNEEETTTVINADSLDTTVQKIELTAVQKQFDGADPAILQQLSPNYLVIKKPVGEHLSISLEDIYINKSIQLTLSGMTTDDLNSSMIARVKGEESFSGEPKFTETTTTEVDKEDGTKEEVITKDFGDDLSHGITITATQDEASKQYAAQVLIVLDSVYAYTMYEDETYYYIDLKKPSDVYDKIVVVDAGHGGKDGGAASRDDKYLEKNMNLDIVLALKELLDKEKDIKVYYTRTKDETVYLRPRVELGNAVDCDYFVSIHCNANDVSSPNGSEVLYYNNEFKGVKNLDLAELFSKAVGNEIPLKNKGTVERHFEDLYIMDKAKIPMILIEVGYLTNNNDMNFLSKEDNRKAVAKGIYNGILDAFEQLPVDK